VALQIEHPRPEGQQDKPIFTAIAARYDLINHLISFGLDRYWRWRLIRELRPELRRARLILDLCTGTADIALALARQPGFSGKIIGVDLTPAMLARGAQKIAAAGLNSKISLEEGDALHLRFPNDHFDLITMAFGLRNLPDRLQGLAEVHRVLRPGGWFFMLEFALPENKLLRSSYLCYLQHVVPLLGGIVSGSAAAYRYLARSIREFPPPGIIAEKMLHTGFREIRVGRLSGGTVALYRGQKL